MPDQEKLLNAIDSYSSQSYGSDSDGGELSRERALSLDAFAGKNLEPAPEGRSQVGDRTIFETVSWIMPSLARIFAGGDNIVEFEPTGPEDEEVAEQESEYLNFLVTQRNDWEMVVREWCQDALLTKNAYCMAYMEERKTPEIERYERQTEEQIALLMEDDPEVVGQNQYDDPDDEGTVIDPTTGQPVQDEETLIGAMAIYQANGMEPQLAYRQLFDIDIRRVKTEKRLRFKVLPPERVKVGEDCTDFTLEDCKYFEFWDFQTISDLRRMGYDIPDDLADDIYTETDEDASRDEAYNADRELDYVDPAMRQVVARWIWIEHDYDEDGIAELQHVLLVGRTILDMEPATCIPVACIVPFINTHRHIGMSVSDLVFDIQRIKTTLLRAGLDSLYLSVNPRHAVSDKVTIDDMLTVRPGGLVRLKNGGIPGEGHIMPLPTEFVFPQAQEGLRHMDSVVESRVGVNRMFQGIDQSAMSSTNAHNAIGQLSTMASQRVEDIARIFGQGFKRLFKIAHELVIKSGHSKQSIRLRGQWVDIDPSQWRTGRDMRVVAPYSAGNKDNLLQRLMIISQLQEKMLVGGLQTVDQDNVYNLALDMAKAADTAGDRYFTDPSTVEPPEPPVDHTLIALEVENKKADNEAADEARQAELEEMRIATDAQVKELVARINSETQIALAQLKAGASVDLEQFKANIKNAPVEHGNEAIKAQGESITALNEQVTKSIEAVTDAIRELKRVQNAPVKIVRKGGKIVGKEVDGQFIPLEEVQG